MIGRVLRDGWVKFPLEKGSMFEYPWLMNYDQGCHLVRVSGWKFPLASTVVWHAPPPHYFNRKQNENRSNTTS